MKSQFDAALQPMNIKFVLQTSHFGIWVILPIGCQSKNKTKTLCKTGKSPLFDYIPGGSTKVIPGNFIHKEKKMMNICIYQEKKVLLHKYASKSWICPPNKVLKGSLLVNTSSILKMKLHISSPNLRTPWSDSKTGPWHLQYLMLI